MKGPSGRMKEHEGELSVSQYIMAPKFCIAFIFEASGQHPGPEAAIRHANKDSSHVKLPP